MALAEDLRIQRRSRMRLLRFAGQVADGGSCGNALPPLLGRGIDPGGSGYSLSKAEPRLLKRLQLKDNIALIEYQSCFGKRTLYSFTGKKRRHGESDPQVQGSQPLESFLPVLAAPRLRKLTGPEAGPGAPGVTGSTGKTIAKAWRPSRKYSDAPSIRRFPMQGSWASI